MDISVSYRLTVDEVARAQSAGIARQLRAFRVLLPTLLVVCGLFAFLIEAYIFGFGFLAGAIVFPLALPWSTRRAVRRQSAHLAGPATLHLTDDGYEARGENFTQSLRWAMFDRVDSTEEFWLFSAKGQFIAFLPVAAFDDEQRAELQDEFARRIAA